MGLSFFIYSDTLCLLIRVLCPLTFRVITERYEVIVIVLHVKSLFLDIVTVPFGLCYFWDLHLGFSFHISHRVGLMFTNSFQFCLSWKLFISPSIVNDSFDEYINLGFIFFSLSTLNISYQSFLPFWVSVDRSAASLMYLLLEVMDLLKDFFFIFGIRKLHYYI